MKTTYVILSIVLIAFLTVPIVGTTGNSEREQGSYAGQYGRHPVMRPDSETRHKLLKSWDPVLQPQVSLKDPSQRGSCSLLSHLSYVPVERDQGSCGNCWVWAGTGVLEVALDVNEAVLDRLSVQYFNSKYNGGTGPSWAGCGGWLSDFSDFYADEGFAIPWSNTNAFYADGHQTSGEGTSVPWQTISTVPNYTITQCTSGSITTHGVGQNAAINNIKSVIDQGKAVWFGYFLATGADWDQFFDFWNYQSENAAWTPDFSCGDVWDSGGGGHAVLCVGYDDLDPNNSYWIMVNSWDTAYGGRPNGIFRVNMNMDYDCYFFDPYPQAYYSLYWQTLNVTYDIEGSPQVSSLQSLASEIIGAQGGTVYYVRTGNVYDDSALGFVYGKSTYVQNIVSQWDGTYVNRTTGEPLFSGSIVTFGGRIANRITMYYEDHSLAKIGFAENATHYMFRHIGTGSIVYAVAKSTYNPSVEDYLAIEGFTDEERAVLILTGIASAVGTYATGICFADLVWPHIVDFGQSYYIFCWNDLNGDGVQTSNELSLKASGD